MKRSEVGEILAIIALSDNRIVGEMNIRAWHDVLPEWLTLADAKDAVRNHRRTSAEYLKEFHVIEYAQQLRRSRMAANHVVPEIPAGLNQGQERAWTLTFWDAVKSGSTDPQGYADAALRIQRPQLPAADRARLAALVAATPAGKPAQLGRRAHRNRPPVPSHQTAGETA